MQNLKRKDLSGLWWFVGGATVIIGIGIATRNYMRSKYFTLDDVNSASAARKHKVRNNLIPDHLLPNAQGLAREILDPMVEDIAPTDAVDIGSWYRNSKLNDKVGGITDSTHGNGDTADVDISTQSGLRKALQGILKRARYQRLIVYLGEGNYIKYFHVQWSPDPDNLLFYKVDGDDTYHKTDINTLAKFIRQ